MATHRGSAFRQRGMGIVETMVGILIGMVVLIAVYNVFAVAEGYKRTTVGAADAQTTGLFTQFVLNREIANAGNGISGAAAQLGTCTLVDPNWPSPAGFFAGNKAIRPLPVVIRDSGNPDLPDSMIITYSTAPHVISPELLVDTPMAVGTDPVYVQSPNGYRVDDLIVLNDMSGNCEIVAGNGRHAGQLDGRPQARLRQALASRHHQDLQDERHDGRTECLQSRPARGGDPYLVRCRQRSAPHHRSVHGGRDRQSHFAKRGADQGAIRRRLRRPALSPFVPTGVIVWTAATNSGVCGRNYAPDDLTNTAMFTAGGLATIRAIRIAIVVRSDEPDLKDPALVGQTATLFNCSTAACTGSINLTNATLTDNYRFRIYETVVPMRNAIFNDGT